MKRILTAFAASLALLTAVAASPALTIDSPVYDFGTIQEADGPVTHEFIFTNTGDAPLIIVSAKASCGCTKPQIPKAPIKPGESAKVRVTYNPVGRPGEFEKNIRVTTNLEDRTSLKIKGVVIPQRRQQPQ